MMRSMPRKMINFAKSSPLPIAQDKFALLYINRKDQKSDRGPRSLENVIMNATRHVTEDRNVTTDNDFFTCLSLAR